MFNFSQLRRIWAAALFSDLSFFILSNDYWLHFFHFCKFYRASLHQWPTFWKKICARFYRASAFTSDLSFARFSKKHIGKAHPRASLHQWLIFCSLFEKTHRYSIPQIVDRRWPITYSRKISFDAARLVFQNRLVQLQTQSTWRFHLTLWYIMLFHCGCVFRGPPGPNLL